MTAPAAAVGPLGLVAAAEQASAAGVAAAGAAPGTLVGSSVAYYALLTTLAEQAGLLAATMWGDLDPNALLPSWTGNNLTDRLLLTTGVAQEAAARAAGQYVAAATRAQTLRQGGAELLAPSVFRGVASDGRNMDDLLRSPLLWALGALAAGGTAAVVLPAARERLKTIVQTQITDTARMAAQVAMAAEPEVSEWVRAVVPPACSRCVVLAGKRFRTRTAFLRHPRCRCFNIPAVEDAVDDLRTDPDAYFASLTAREQDSAFTVAGAEAIRAGANIGQVVNARRGASGLEQPGRLTAAEAAALRSGRPARLERVDVYGRSLAITAEGTTRRGLAGSRLIAESGTRRDPRSRYQRAKTPRLMPEAIAEVAVNDEDYVRLLRRFGYLL